MILELRKEYNKNFTRQAYEAYLKDLEGLYPGQLDFRIAETPIFIPASFQKKMLDACEHIIDVVNTQEYLKESERSIPSNVKVPSENNSSDFIAFDFGICEDGNGGYEPQLIEMQGFPSLFAWQVLLPEVHEKHFGKPAGFSPYLHDYNRESYIALLRSIIIGDCAPENVVLLEILPHQQKTRVDFYATKELLGIEIVCLTDLIVEGKKLFYLRNGVKTSIDRIYNRVIFDDLFSQPEEIREKGSLFMEDLDVTWVPHPNWFYRLSKFTLPFIDHPYVPKTTFLNPSQLPDDLQNYVVKPLFSFAGQGVIIDVTPEEISKIKDPQNWIIQKKVPYAAIIKTPDENAKAEIRIFYFRENGSSRPVPVNNLCRLSKGKMVGVRYNKDKEWVGGSFCLFEP